mmetsp:Transcript_43424/g.114444  ORF Transcript_43424/g.114444 Transcript_43424/m.114444 type:complete len:117 (-) Transcript_43424:32-382(-)
MNPSASPTSRFKCFQIVWSEALSLSERLQFTTSCEIQVKRFGGVTAETRCGGIWMHIALVDLRPSDVARIPDASSACADIQAVVHRSLFRTCWFFVHVHSLPCQLSGILRFTDRPS